MREPEAIHIDGFRRWLASEMQARGISQRALAHHAGVHHSTLSRVLRTGRQPSLETAGRLARALNTPLPAFGGGSQHASIPDIEGIRRVLSELGLRTADVEEMVAAYRRRQLQRRAG